MFVYVFIVVFVMKLRTPRSTLTHPLSLHDALPISADPQPARLPPAHRHLAPHRRGRRRSPRPRSARRGLPRPRLLGRAVRPPRRRCTPPRGQPSPARLPLAPTPRCPPRRPCRRPRRSPLPVAERPRRPRGDTRTDLHPALGTEDDRQQ